MTKNQLRKLLESNDLTQSAAARELHIDPRTMRRYVLGESPVPRVVELALRYVALIEAKQTN
jgi:transcriptional regulator with XRE-family HTH domain